MLGCASKKNTSTTRMYHAINTKYNIYFNANEAYKESLKSKQAGYQDNLSQIISIYPGAIEEEEIKQRTGGSFDVTVDKTTKAIKIHSIRTKPERDPAKRKNQEYQAWLKQQEFNPFLKNAWLLLGKAEFQNEDYIQAVSTLLYITRLYKGDNDVVAEARIWIAKAYTAMGWFYEAEDIFHKIKLAGGVPENLTAEYNKVYADFLIKRKEYEKAIPFLEQAIKDESDGFQKIRMKYLLGQLYSHTKNQEKAFQAFESVTGLNTPYLYSFNAKMQQASFVNSSNKQEILSLLTKMSKDPKNKEYLDQVYYAIGNIYLNNQDTAKAITEYEKAVKASTRNGYDKALSQIALGDIYFAQQKYAKAQPNYSEALASISKKHEAYPRVTLRAEVLDELVVHIEAIHLQDSLQNLSQKPYEEQVAVVTKIIADLRKKEEAEKREQQKLERENNNSSAINPNSPFFEQSSPNIPSAPVNIGGNSSSFYFYNPQLVNQGKVAFQRKWGNRKLEDNWRRRNKRVTTFDEGNTNPEADQTPKDSVQTSEPKAETPASQDVYSPEFYLQQIPMTPEAIKASNEIIENAFFSLGKLYKDKLEDYNLAIDAFTTNLSRFPNGPNREEIYYQLFLIYLRLGNKEMTELYRRYLLNSFPKSSYAAALADPNYEWNLRNMHQLEDNLYQQTYEAYLAANINTVRSNYQSMKEKYPLSALIPKFMFLNALTYAQTNDPDEFKTHLRDLIEKYPKADVTPLASDMLKGILGGKTLSSDSSPARGMIWDIRFGTGENPEEMAGVDFVANPDAEYMLLFIYKSQTIDKNQLIYDVASYNFSSFIYQTFDLSFTEANSLEMLQVKGFKSLAEIEMYIDKAFDKNSLMSELDPSIIPLPISTDNFVALMNGKSLNEYFLFFEKNYTREMVKLIMYWNQQRNKIPPTAEDKPQPEPETITPVVEEPKPEVKPTKPAPPRKITPLVSEEESEDKGKEIGVSDVLSDDQIEQVDNVINKTIDIINNPVDGLKNLFNSSGNKPKLTKEEKAAQKAENKRLKDLEKQRKAKVKAEEQALIDAEQARLDSISNAEKQKQAEERAAAEAKINEQKETVKAREDARKQRQQELKEKEKAQKERLKERERERKERLKQREAERKEKERLAKEKAKKK